MYYLDTFQLYKRTKKSDRIYQRKILNRDEIMEHKLKLQRNLCFYCASDITMKDHLDHVVPVYYGGISSKANLVAACRDCNLIKSTGQIEITNEYTIKDYFVLRQAYVKWLDKCKNNHMLLKQRPKRVHLYFLFYGYLFKEV